jgi:outer membrane protein assembly factor BamB
MARTKIRWLVMLMMTLGASPAMADAFLDVFTDAVSDVPVGTTRIMANGISNFGDGPATITRIEITGADAAHFVFANPAAPACTGGQVCTDAFTLEAGSFAELDIACTPDRSALFTASVTMTSDAANSPTSTTLFCDAAGPHLEITPSTLTFPTTAVGFFSAPQVVQIRNTGFTDIVYGLGAAADFASSLDATCVNDQCFLAPGVTISVSVRFAPRASGALSEQLVLGTSDGNVAIPLRGTATGPEIKLEQPPRFLQPLDLGAALLGTPTAPGTVRIRNIGNQPLHVTGAFPVGGSEASAFSATGPAVPFDVAPNATVEWQVTCRPVRITSNSARLVIESNAGLAELPVPLQCTGNGGALVLDSSTLLPTTAVGSSSTIPMVVRNVGNLPVTITSASIGDPQFAATPHSGGLPITLAPNVTTTFDLTFSPVQGGEQAGLITLANNGALPFIGLARGVGHTGHPDLTPAAPGFGPVPLGTSAQIMAELGNHGDEAVTLASITVGDPAQFQVVGPQLIGAVLQPDEALRFAIQATPGSLGPHDTQITFAFDHGPPTIAHVTATGAAGELAVETWDGRPSDGTAEFGVVKVGSVSTGLLSVTNTGTATLRIASCSIVGDAAFHVAPPCTFELAPSESADLPVTFAPATTGPHTATVRFTSDGSQAMLDVALSGAAIPGPIGCAAGRDQAGGLAVLLVGLLVARRRPRRAQPRAIGLALVIAGCGAGGPDDALPRMPGRGTITVTRTGTGTGTVRSLDHELDCGTRCTATVNDALHLTATPAPGSIFAGWAGACVGTGPCVVTPSATPAMVVARFEHAFRLTIASDAPVAPFSGEVTVNGERCALPCARDVIEGTTVTLDAFTLSTFTGWSGGCTPTAAPCTLTITANVALTAHFAAPDERWTAVADDLVPTAVTAVSDDPVVAGSDGTDVVVARYTATGTRTWLTRIAAGPNPQIIGLDHNTGGQVYVLVHTEDPDQSFGALILQKLDAGGQALWSTTLDASSIQLVDDAGSLAVKNEALAVAPDGDAIIVALSPTLGSFVRAYADDGSVHWTQTLPQTFPQDVSVDAAGIVTVPSRDFFDRGRVDRYAANGSRLIHYDLPPLINDDSFVVSFHAFAVAGDALVCASADSFGGSLVIRALDVATGATTRWLEDLSAGVSPKVALRADGHGGVLMLDPGSAVRKLVDRTIAWRRAPDHHESPGGATDQLGAADLAADAHGRAIEVGSWIRACAAGQPCTPDHQRVSGFIRSYAP